MRTARNYLAGLGSSVWSAIVTLAVVPFYLHFLGMEAYGLIGFLAFAQGLVALLDLGLAPTISREVARCMTRHTPTATAELVRTLAIVYWIVAVAILLGFWVIAPFIAEHWLSNTQLASESVTTAVRLMGLVIACRWPLALYQGVLIGAQRLLTLSFINMAIVGMANLGGVAVIALGVRRVEALFLWQGIIALVGSFMMMGAAWRVLGVATRVRFSWPRLAEVWRFSAGMTLVAITATLLMQLDKGILSSMLGLSEFGHYMLAVVMANSLYVVLRPLFNTIYPRMSALVAAGDTDRLVDFYIVGTRLLASALFPLVISAALFADDLILLWTRESATASAVAPLARLLIWGTALNGIMHFPYALQLAYGRPRVPFTINCVLIAVSAPTTVALTIKFGAVGGAASWLIMNTTYLLYGTWLTHRLMLRGIMSRWLTQSVVWPLIISTAVVGGVCWLIHMAAVSAIWHITFAALAAAVGILLNFQLDRLSARRLLRSIGLTIPSS